ncbi:hypothetical protein ASJ79_30420 [Mycobacterium sp. NAZ190054]|nr:hypothetical protein ASJ79_30420 [Mycobacterium sp. NAZ190054]
MLTAHALAIVIGAVLIDVGARLCGALSSALRVVTSGTLAPASAPERARTGTADQPMRSALMLGCSMSYRGPPVTAHR